MTKRRKKHYKSITKRSLLPLSAREVPRRGGGRDKTFSCCGYEAFSLTRFAGPLTKPDPFAAQREPKSDYNFISC